MSTIKSSGENLKLSSDNTKDIELQHNGDTKVTVKSDGKVGIGMSSPTGLLQIEGTTDHLKLTYPSIASYILDVKSNSDFAIDKDGTERMRIDSAGRVTMPYQPAFFVKTNYAARTLLTNGASPDWSETLHNRGNHFDLTNNYFVAPVDGVYQFNCNSLIDLASNSGYAWMRIYVNGGAQATSHSDTNGITNYTDVSLSVSLSLSASDQVTIGAHITSGPGWYNGVSFNSFSGHLIG